MTGYAGGDTLPIQEFAKHERADVVGAMESDRLPRVFNRRGFESQLAWALSYIKRYGNSAALICLDLNGLRRMNEREGAVAGDVVLQAVGASLTRWVRASDSIGCIGEDEFAVLLWNITEPHVEAKAQRLEQQVRDLSILYGTAQLSITASAGTTILGPLDTPAEVIERADLALAARKAQRPAYQAQ